MPQVCDSAVVLTPPGKDCQRKESLAASRVGERLLPGRRGLPRVPYSGWVRDFDEKLVSIFAWHCPVPV